MSGPPAARSGRPRVLVTGPAPPPLGGVAAVIQSMLDSELEKSVDFVRFDMTRQRVPRTLLTRAISSVLARGFGFDGAASLESFARLRALWRTADEVRPDLLHIHASHGYDFWLAAAIAHGARRREIPAILHTHGHFTTVVPRYSSLRKAAFRRALAGFERLIVLGNEDRAFFGAWMDSGRIEVIPNSVDVARFPLRDRSGPAAELCFLFVGTSTPRIKGAYELLEAIPEVLRAVPNARFLFVGEDVEELEARFVRGTPIAPACEFVGGQAPAEMPACFEHGDVLVMPSLLEVMPVALLEGYAAGLPVVASAVAHIPEVLHDGDHGRLVPPGDAGALARAMIEVARDPVARQRMGAQNRRCAETEFDLTHFADRLGTVYASVLAGVRRP